MKRRKKQEHEEKGRAVPIERYFPDELQVQYSDDAIVQHSDEVFYLSFFQVEKPITLTKAETERVKKIRARCVSRIIVTPEQMWRIVNAFQENFKKFAAKHDISVEELQKATEEFIDDEDLESNESIGKVDQSKSEAE